MFWVYVLRDEITEKLYVGSCSDLDRRLAEHKRLGKQFYKLIHTEQRATKLEALKREAYLKSGNGRRALKNLLVGSPATRPAGERL